MYQLKGKALTQDGFRMNKFKIKEGTNKKVFRGLSANSTNMNFGQGLQSPKISNGKERSVSVKKPKLFSLRDINDKITDAHGLSMPFQFKRLTDDEIKKKFPVTVHDWKRKFYFNHIAKAQEESKQVCQTEGAEKKPNTEIKEKEQPKEIVKIPTTKLTIDAEESKNTTDNKPQNIPQKNQRRAPKTATAKKPVLPVPLSTRADKWKPEGYAHYDVLVKRPEAMKRELMSNPVTARLPNITIREIRDKGISSDIFFLKEDDKVNNYAKLVKKRPDHMNSDIFCIKNDLTSIEKNGEVFLFRPKKRETYTVNNPSGSEWHAKTKEMPTLLNHESEKWNMMNPSCPSTARTKREIQDQGASNNFNPIFRQKSLCEFIDLTRVGAPNANKTYRECFKAAPECFMKRTDVCGDYYNNYNGYRDLIDKPFAKPKLIY